MVNLSIIIPACNSERHIADCLASCLQNQSLSPTLFEAIVIDDGSSDSTSNIVVEFQKEYPNLKLFSKENGGVSSARNLGIREAKGKYILFVDSDDQIADNSLIQLADYLLNESIELCILNSVSKQENISKKRYPFPASLSSKKSTGLQLFEIGYLRGSVCGVAFLNPFLMENTITFEEGLANGEDSLFMVMCLMHAQKVTHLDIDFYIVNERIGSASRSWDTEKIMRFINSLNIIRRYIDENNLNKNQLAMLHIKAYGIISNTLYHYAQLKGHTNRLGAIKKVCETSKMYPIHTFGHNHFRLKIKLLNFSFGLFYLSILIKQKLSVFRNKTSKR